MILFKSKKGMAGIIVTVAILGLLMSTATSYVKIIQTEAQVTSSIDYSDRAMDAAFSGIQYGMAIAQTKDALFIDNATEAQKRIYMASDTTDTAVSSLWGSITPTSAADYPNLVKSDWVYLNENMQYMDSDDTANKPYLYKIAIYPKNDGSNKIATNSYYIKSQGIYRIYDSSGATMTDYKFQMIAEIKIDFLRKKQRLVRWRREDWQSTGATFFTYEDF